MNPNVSSCVPAFDVWDVLRLVTLLFIILYGTGVACMWFATGDALCFSCRPSAAVRSRKIAVVEPLPLSVGPEDRDRANDVEQAVEVGVSLEDLAKSRAAVKAALL